MNHFSHPTLRFQHSTEKDIDTFFDFVRDAQYDEGRSLRWAVFDHFPELEKFFLKGKFIGNRQDIDTFVSKKHEKNQDRIQEKLTEYTKSWAESEMHFFALTEEIFGKRKWPEGKYIAYPTMWGMYPRFLDDKTFQVPFEGKMCTSINEIVTHELLHFIFYDFFFTLFPNYAGEDREMFVWHVTEIFNTIVQNSEKWKKDFPNGTMGYPEHEEIVRKLSVKFPAIEQENITPFSQEIVKSVLASNLPKDYE